MDTRIYIIEIIACVGASVMHACASSILFLASLSELRTRIYRYA